MNRDFHICEKAMDKYLVKARRERAKAFHGAFHEAAAFVKRLAEDGFALARRVTALF